MSNLTIKKNLKLNVSLDWLKQAFITFREQPIQFIILEIFYSLFMFAPFIGAFVTPLIVAKFMQISHRVRNNEQILLKDIFKNMFASGMVVRLAFLNFCLSAIILLAQYLLESNSVASIENAPLAVSSTALLLAIPTLILGIAMWLSPAICLNDNVNPRAAMWLSLKASAVNILPLLLYSIIIAGISVVVIIPVVGVLVWLWSALHSVVIVGLFAVIGYLICVVWFTIMNISTYFVYASIFEHK